MQKHISTMARLKHVSNWFFEEDRDLWIIRQRGNIAGPRNVELCPGF